MLRFGRRFGFWSGRGILLLQLQRFFFIRRGLGVAAQVWARHSFRRIELGDGESFLAENALAFLFFPAAAAFFAEIAAFDLRTVRRDHFSAFFAVTVFHIIPPF